MFKKFISASIFAVALTVFSIAVDTESNQVISVNNTAPVVNSVTFNTTLFANLGTPINGVVVYCSDCTIASPCAGAGTGALAKRLNGIWVCN